MLQNGQEELEFDVAEKGHVNFNNISDIPRCLDESEIFPGGF